MNYTEEGMMMNYNQLQDYALRCSLEHHLCNVEELLDEGKTLAEIMLMIEAPDEKGIILPVEMEGLVVWEPYEYYEPSSLAEAICDLRGVYYHQLMYVLGEVNGKDWVDTYKKRGEE